jgi:hypothetical protein
MSVIRKCERRGLSATTGAMKVFWWMLYNISFSSEQITRDMLIYTVGCTLPPLQAAGAGLAYRITILHTQATRNHRTGCWSGAQGGSRWGAAKVQLKCS